MTTQLVFAKLIFQMAAIRRNHRFKAEKKPPTKRTINELTEREAYVWTRFTKEQLAKLFVLWKIPSVVRIKRYKFTGEEIMLICLTRFAQGSDWTDLADNKFGGEARYMSLMFSWFIDHMFEKHQHMITQESLKFHLFRIDEYRKIICEKLSSKATKVENNKETTIYSNHKKWRIFGFIDDNGIRTCRPGGGERRDEEDELLENAFYR
jgi:hypothetical protein